MIKDDLKSLGFNKNEAAVYAALSALGQVKAGELIKSTGIHRNLVYQALSSLQDKNLVSKSTIGKVAAFQASDPDQLLGLVHEQELTAKRVVEELKKTRKVAEQEIQVLEGADAIRSYRMELARQQTPEDRLHIIGSGGEMFREVMGRQYTPYFELLSRRGGARVLMHPHQTYDQEHASRHGVEIKQLETSSPPAVTIGFMRDEVMFAFYSGVPTVIRMRNQDLADVYRSYFEILWNQTVRVESGWEAMHSSYYGMLDRLDGSGEYYIIGASNGMGAVGADEYHTFYEEMHRERIRRKVTVNMLSFQSHTDEIRERFRRVGDPNLVVSRIRDLAGTAIGIMGIRLYEGKTILEVHGEVPTLITVQDPGIYQGMKQYFDDYWNASVITYRGEEGARRFMADLLSETDVYWIGGNGGIERFHPDVWNWFKKERLAKQIGWYDLIDPGGELSGVQDPDGFYEEPNTYKKVLPSAVASPHVTVIYGDKVANIVWSQESVINVIEDKEVADSQRKYFQYLWDQDVVTRTGMDGAREAFEDIIATLDDGEEVLVMGIFDFDPEFRDFVVDFHKRRARAGKRGRILLNRHATEMHDELKGVSRTQVRYMDQGVVTPTVFLVFGEKVLMTTPGTRTFITVENKEAADAVRTHFETQWGKNTETLIGTEGIKTLFDTVLAERQDVFLLYANGRVLNNDADTYAAFTAERKERGIDIHALAVPEVRDTPFAGIPFKTIKYLSEEFASPMVVWVFGDYVANVLWNVPQTIYLIHDKKTANYYRKHFEALKKIAKP